ncbi:MAG: polysaccharide biosynthesis/export family protein [Verrucomicrobiota bacterium]
MKSKTLPLAALASVFLISPLFSQIEAEQSVIIKIMGVAPEEKVKIDETYPVSKHGKLSLPYIGEIQAAGLDSDQLAKSIQKAYRDGDIFKEAIIQVFSNQTQIDPVAQKVHIGGKVQKPGPTDFTKGLTVYQAVQAAGGASEFGAMNRVILWRNGKQQKIDLKTEEGKGVVAMPNDTIEVPDKTILGK